MPYLLIKTNITPADGAVQPLLQRASRQVAQALGKPEDYVMVALEHSCPMLFAGNDAPLAYLELKSIGLPRTRTAELSAQLAGLLHEELGIAADRVYIEFADAAGPLWGWNGATF
ncbi:MAG: phenylpyruvate tautomerase MIF-related protein [Pseudomonadota bacterium]